MDELKYHICAYCGNAFEVKEPEVKKIGLAEFCSTFCYFEYSIWKPDVESEEPEN